MEYPKNTLISILHDEDIIGMDSIRFHHVKEVSTTIKNSDKYLTLLYLSPYSSDFNPIEIMWLKIKSVLRMLKIRDNTMLLSAIKTAFSKIIPLDCFGWFSTVRLVSVI